MTLGDKIKHALHMDKDKTGSASETGVTSAEPQTGPEAYQPLTQGTHGSQSGQNVSGGTTTQGNSGRVTGPGGGGSSAGTGTGTGAGGGGVQSASGQGVRGSSAGTGTGTGAGAGGVQSSGGAGGYDGQGRSERDISSFSEGYKEPEPNKPGYSSSFKKGDPQYTEKYTEGDDKWSAELSAETDNKHWEHAREMTLAAEHEAAQANLAGSKAGRELKAAEDAELAVRKAQQKHREALLEAEKYKDAIGTGSKERDLSEAHGLYNEKRAAADEAERLLREAEAELAAKKRDHDKLRPKVEQFGETLPGLESDYERRRKEREGVEGERERVVLSVKEAEDARRSYAADLEALERELDNAERIAAEKQQEYIDARNRAQSVSQRIADLRARVNAADEDLYNARGRVQEVEENLPAYREAEQRALRELENSKGEWYRLKELEDEYARSWKDANDRLKGLHGKHDPASKELRDVQSLLAAKQDDLDRARSRSVQAEAKYKELLALANRHKKYGDSAATVAEGHGEKYDALKKEAHIHGDKHVEYWNEAKGAGEEGSTMASNAVRKLEERVKQLMGKKNEP